MTSRLHTLALSLWTASAVATTLLAQVAAGVGTTRGEVTGEPVRTVDSVDLDRYVGEWFEVARFWILARTPALAADRFAPALAAARANGFDVERLTKTLRTANGREGTR